jgi:hypothetical protein
VFDAQSWPNEPDDCQCDFGQTNPSLQKRSSHLGQTNPTDKSREEIFWPNETQGQFDLAKRTRRKEAGQASGELTHRDGLIKLHFKVAALRIKARAKEHVVRY